MLPNHRIATNYEKYIVKCETDLPLLPPKYTIEDWEYNNNLKFRITKQQEKLTERIVEDSKLTIDEVTQTTISNQRDVEHQTKQRAEELRFVNTELGKIRKALVLETEAIEVSNKRTLRAIEFLAGKSLDICKQCLRWREQRIGVECCDDDVDRELRREIKTIKGCQVMLDRLEKEQNHQICRLRAVFHKIDFDMANQLRALGIDERNNNLKQGHLDLGVGVDLTARKCCVSMAEWLHETYCTIESMTRELTSIASFRTYTDLMLKQVSDDMRLQTERTNLAFENRLKQVKLVKKELEDKHCQTSISIRKVRDTIALLEDEIKDKDRAKLLCQTRLGNRSQRPGLELTCDMAQQTLLMELCSFETTMCKLNRRLCESNALLRYLQHTLIMQEEEINLKTNDIKIDEADCMPIRQVLVYTDF